MRILLFSMPDATHPFFPRFCHSPNLGLVSLAGSLKDEAEVHVADLVLRRKDVPGAVREALERVRPDLVGLSCMTFQYYTATRIAELIRSWNPEVPIALGGYHATLMHREIADTEPGRFDFLCRGESEATFREMVRCLGRGRAGLENVAGLSWRRGQEFVHNPDRPLCDLAGLPRPDRTRRLWSGYHIHGWPFDTAETSRGCTMPCNFCSITRMYGRSFRAFPMERVVADLEDSARLGAKEIFFTDDNITLQPGHLDQLCRAVVESGLHRRLLFSTQTSVAGLGRDLSIIGRMAEAGFNFVFLGIENVCRRNLRAYRKDDTTRQARAVVAELRRHRIVVMGGFILGAPDDTEADVVEQFRFMREMQLDSYLVQILTPYPKVPLTQELESQGLVVNRDWRRYSGAFANVRTRHLSSRQLDFLRWEHFPYNRSPRWFLEATIPRRYPMIAVKETVSRFCEGILEKARKRFISPDYAFRKYMERHLAANLFFGETPDLSWPDEA